MFARTCSNCISPSDSRDRVCGRLDRQPDYSPGEVVTIHGDNSDNAGYLSGETVHVDVVGPNNYTAACDPAVSEDPSANGAWSCQVTLWDSPLAAGSYSYTAVGRESGTTETGVFLDSPGSYNIKLYAADPETNRAPYLPTYPKVKPAAMACPTPSGGVGRAADPLTNAVAYGPTFIPSDLDAVTSLMPKDLALGQIVPFEVEINVNGSTAPENGTIQFVADWLAKTTSGKDFGFDPAYLVYCAFVDTADVGVVDAGGNAKVDSFSGVVLGTGTNNERIEGTIKVSGFDDGDNIIVEVWVVLKSTISANANGNVQTSLQSAQTCTNASCSSGSKISVGNQTVPLLQVGDFFTANADVAVTKSDSPDPVVAGQQLTYSLVVINNSTNTVANGIVVNDTLDPNVSFVSGTWSGGTCTAASGIVTCNVGALSPGQSTTITIVTTVSLTAPMNNDPSTNPETGTCTAAGPGTDLCNKVSFTMITSDPNTTNNSDSEPTNVVANPAIDIQKTPNTQSVTYGGSASSRSP